MIIRRLRQARKPTPMVARQYLKSSYPQHLTRWAHPLCSYSFCWCSIHRTNPIKSNSWILLSILMIIYIDVDNTLVRSFGGRQEPIPEMVSHVRQLRAEGAELYLWSAGGADYCRRTAEALHISECFKAFLPKPRIIIDDQQVCDWVHCETYHPDTSARMQLKDYFLPAPRFGSAMQ